MTGIQTESTYQHIDSTALMTMSYPPRAEQLNLLRLLMVTPRYYPYIGGVETHVREVAQRLVRSGVDVTVLTTDLEGNLPAQEQFEGVNIQRVRAWPAKKDYYFAPDIYKIIAQGNWNIVHIQSYHTFVAPLAMFSAWRAKIPYVVTFHGGGNSSSFRNMIRRTQRALLRPLFAHASRLIAVAQFEIEFYGKELHIPKEKFCLSPNGSDLPTLRELDVSHETQGTLIASVGRLERYKGHQRIISALPRLIEQIPDLRLWIAGVGPYEFELRGLARKLGVEERVEIRAIPSAQHAEMAEELSKAALVVLLSEYETHPISILEALSLGKPVLVADTSGLSELAAKGWAHAIPLDSTPNEIAAAVVQQIANPVKPANITLPSWDDCSNSLLRVYRAIAQEPV